MCLYMHPCPFPYIFKSCKSVCCMLSHTHKNKFTTSYMNTCVYSLMCAYVYIFIPTFHMLHIKLIYLFTCMLQIYNSSNHMEYSYTRVCSHAPMCVHTHSSCLHMWYIFVCMFPHLAHTHTHTHVHSPLYTCLWLHLLPTSVNVCAHTSSHKQMGHCIPVSLPSSLLSLDLTL